MGIWKEVKHALNSTLGGSGFKSLDNIVKDLIFPTKNYTLSGSLGQTFISSETTVSGTTSTIAGTISAEYNGPIQISAKLKCSREDNLGAYLFVSELSASTQYSTLESNNVLYFETTSTSTPTYQLLSGTFYAEKGKTYYLHFVTSYYNYTGYCNYLKSTYGLRDTADFPVLSIQNGEVTSNETSVNVTIRAINSLKSIIIVYADSNAIDIYPAWGKIVNDTTIAVGGGGTSSNPKTSLKWQVISFY